MTTKTKRLNRGLYEFTIFGRHYEIERTDASNGYNLKGTFAVWDLFEMKNGRREWHNDFRTKREAIEHAQSLGRKFDR